MRRALQQGQDGSFDHAARGWEDQDANGGTLFTNRLATEQKVRARCRCFQALNNVRSDYISWPARLVCLTYSRRNPDVWNEVTFPSEVVKSELQSYISKRLTPQPTKVRADVEVTCFGYDGIDAVKTALRCAEAKNTPDNQVKVKLVSPPLYVLTSQCLEKTIGISTLEEAIKDIDLSIRISGGGCVTKMAPKAVTENDDAELQALMEKRERENMEVSGDESMSESDDAVVTETIWGVLALAVKTDVSIRQTLLCAHYIMSDGKCQKCGMFQSRENSPLAMAT